MNTILKRLLPVLLTIPAIAVTAAEPDAFYRVEVIVFIHEQGHSDARPASEFVSFAGVNDPLQNAAKRAEMQRGTLAGDNDSAEQQSGQPLTAADRLEVLDEQVDDELMPAIPKWPEAYHALDTWSARMQDALDRLERSPDYRVLSSLAWHQPLETARDAQSVRIHDGQVISAEWIELQPHRLPAIGQLAESGAGALRPQIHYRLDGSLRLVQRQFLHLEADLHWRGPVRAEAMTGRTRHADDARFEIHRLDQRRTVRPGRMEYFDSSWLGLLLLIESIEPLDGSGETEEEAESEPIEG